MLKYWRGASFSFRFALVLGIMGFLVASVPVLLVSEQARNIATDHVAGQAQLVTSIVADDRSALNSYASDIAAQLRVVRRVTTQADETSQLAVDSSSATSGDILGLMAPSGAASAPIFETGGRALAASDATAVRLVAAVAAHQATASAPDGRPWLLATDAVGDGSTVVVARLLRGDIVPDVAIVRGGVVSESGSIADNGVAAGTRVDPAIATVAGQQGEVAVVTASGTEVAVTSVDLGAGYTAVLTRAVNGIGNVDPIIIALAGLSLLAVLLTVTIVQHDLYRPLRRLDRAAAALAEGNFDIPIPGRLGGDVVGSLATTFEVTRRRLAVTLQAARARASIATELNTPQPLRAALATVCTTLRDFAGAEDALIIVAESETGDAFVCSAEGVRTDVAALMVPGSPFADALARHHTEPFEIVLLDPLDDAATQSVAAAPIGSGASATGVIALIGNDRLALRDSVDLILAAADQVALALERYRILSVIERQASTDDMTGLRNHRFLVDYLGQQIAVAERQGVALTVLMLDIDHFKRLNDEHGHLAGDRGLEAFAQTVKGTIRRSDLAARYGGEEFVVVMPNTNATEAALVAEKIRAAVADIALDVGGRKPVRFTVSIGVASLPDNTVNGAQLIGVADEALYAAKSGGRNRVVISEARPDAAAPPPAVKRKEPSSRGRGLSNR